MNKTAGTIEINGNRYDAVSGQLIGAARSAAKHITRPIDGLSIDGFSRPVKAVKKSAVKRSIHTLQRKPEKSKTLMRSAVKKPQKADKDQKTITSRNFLPNYARASRASSVPRHTKVQRFGLSLAKRSDSAVKTGEVLPKGASFGSGDSISLSKALPAMGNASHQKLERLLDYALASADAHKKALAIKRRDNFLGRMPKWVKFTAIIATAAVLAGVLLWQKMPVASMKLAASRAHINASLPSPISGFKIGPISSSEHTVMTTIQSITDSGKKYTVTEQQNSQPASSLQDSVAAKGQVQKVQDQDKTYILSQNEGSSEASCTKGNNTVNVASSDLNVAELLDAAKAACKT